jgi:hypothetical protein
VETTGLNSREVLATLFALELKGIVRQLPGNQFNKVLLSALKLDPQRMPDASERGYEASRSRRRKKDAG